MTEWFQKSITLGPVGRGFHIVTREILDELPELQSIGAGMLHLNILHTSAGLTINENASRDVLTDFASFFDRNVPDGADYFLHVEEGPDDMSAHIKSAIVGHSLSIPVKNGRLVLGTWQGIYLCEFRDHGSYRRVVATILGSVR